MSPEKQKNFSSWWQKVGEEASKRVSQRDSKHEKRSMCRGWVWRWRRPCEKKCEQPEGAERLLTNTQQETADLRPKTTRNWIQPTISISVEIDFSRTSWKELSFTDTDFGFVISWAKPSKAHWTPNLQKLFTVR